MGLSLETRQVFVVLLVAACGTDDPSRRRPGPATLMRTNPCEVRASGSRWIPGDVRYAMAAEFGHGEGEALIDLWGIAATPAGQVLVYDAGATRVFELGSDLHVVDTFGRAGGGPGELSYQRAPAGDWIAADDSSIVVLDLRTFSEFDLTGEFRRYPTRDPPFPLPIERIALRHGRIVYAVDRVDRGDGTRALETWRLEASGSHTLLRTDAMPRLPTRQGRVVRGVYVDQAEPLWAVHRGCAFVSDGAGDWILRVDLTENRADTLHLPARDVPARSAQDERRMERLRRAAAAAGMGSGPVQPTARRKWQNLVVDPDGFVWLEPWRSFSMRQDPLAAWVVDPATGAVDSVVVEAFPDAFLPGGEYVSLAYDRTEGKSLVRKYAFRRSME